MERPMTAEPTVGATGTHGSTMVAVTQDRYGGPDVLSTNRAPRPAPGEGEVLVRVHAASVNARDWHVMRGEPRLARLLDRRMFAIRHPRSSIRGTDLAGTVVEVGQGVTTWRKGDRVFGDGTGSFAEYALAPADRLASVPEQVTFEQAAALPLAATTALMCLTAARPAPGARVLVNGASGGVGTFALQLARTMDLNVTAVVSSRNVSLARKLGAHEVVDYTQRDFTTGEARYDVVVDLVGNRRLRDLTSIVNPGGSLVLSGGGVPGRGRLTGPLGLLLRGAVADRFLPVSVLLPQASPTSEALDRVADLVATGQLTPVIDRRFRLEAVPEALTYMEHEHAKAKVVISVAT